LPHLPLDDAEVESLHFVETFRDPLQRAMENETNNELDEELIEATKGTRTTRWKLRGR
jgi:hypothetical protein